jgi:cell division septation protein DedD
MNPGRTSHKKKGPPFKADITFILITAGISLFAFAAGIFLGKKLTPQDKVQDLARRVKETNSQDKFTFFYTLPIKGPQEPGSRSSFPPPAPPARTEAQKVPPISTKTERRKPTETGTRKEPPLQPPETIPPAPSETGKYMVQVASFRSPGEAEKLSRVLKKEGYSVHLIKADLGEEKGLWYRVRVGYFDSGREAEKQIPILHKKIGLKGFVTKPAP